MAGMLGIFNVRSKGVNYSSLLETIDLAGTGQRRSFSTRNGYVATANLPNSRFDDSYYYEDKDFFCCFSGDLVDFVSIPWDDIIEFCKNSSFERFGNLKGNFAIAVIDKPYNKFYLISDRLSQYLVYYSITDSSFIFSTALSTFVRLQRKPDFNINWLYEYFFFNFPIGQNSFLVNVKRMPQSSVLKYDFRTSAVSVFKYAPPFKKPPELMLANKALERALSIFKGRVPKYFDKDRRIALGISSGFDSRTLLALAPPNSISETYTYGVPGCSDLKGASALCNCLKIPHRDIVFGRDFTDALPDLIYKTVWISNGLQGINRSSLMYVYEELINRGRHQIVISGVSGDHLFRGHGNVPSIISADMEKTFITNSHCINHQLFKRIFGQKYREFEGHINNVLTYIRTNYGPFNLAQTHLNYFMYEVAPKYFAGEAAIANNYALFRCPYWDADIMKLAYEISLSTLSFSRFLGAKKDGFAENILQANIIETNKDFADIPVRSIPLTLYTGNHRILYKLYRTLIRGPRYIRNKMFPNACPPLEDWKRWYKETLRQEINNLLGTNCAACDYIDVSFIEEIKRTNNTYWLSKLATVEIILKLIKNNWHI